MNIDCGGGAWERGGKKPDSAEISSNHHSRAYINGTVVQVDTDVRSKYGSRDGNRWERIET